MFFPQRKKDQLHQILEEQESLTVADLARRLHLLHLEVLELCEQEGITVDPAGENLVAYYLVRR